MLSQRDGEWLAIKQWNSTGPYCTVQYHIFCNTPCKGQTRCETRFCNVAKRISSKVDILRVGSSRIPPQHKTAWWSPTPHPWPQKNTYICVWGYKKSSATASLRQPRLQALSRLPLLSTRKAKLEERGIKVVQLCCASRVFVRTRHVFAVLVDFSLLKFPKWRLRPISLEFIWSILEIFPALHGTAKM